MEPDLYRALRAKDIHRVRECLKDWGNENKRVWWTGPRRALTPLHVASKGSSQDILSELLRHPEIGRGINTFSDKKRVTPLHEAAGSSSPEVVRLLLGAGADISSPSGDGSTAFHIACSRGRIETCIELLLQGSPLESRDDDGMTPLLRAAAAGRVDVSTWLLREGADPAAIDVNGNTALALSCRAASLCLARAFVDAGTKVVSKNKDGHCCVELAARSGKADLLNTMLEAMVRSGETFSDGGGDVLYDAIDRGLDDVVDLLTSGLSRELGINVSRPNGSKQGTTPLHAACFRGQLPIIEKLLARGADPNKADDNGLRSLHIACASPDSLHIVKTLLNAQAEANVKDEFACTPIYYAFIRGNDEIVRFMLGRGASLFRMDYDQGLRIACFYGMAVEVESLLWMEADPKGVLYNHRDRGAVFHHSVNPATRNGINDLLAEAADGGSEGVRCGGRDNAAEQHSTESTVSSHSASDGSTSYSDADCHSSSVELEDERESEATHDERDEFEEDGSDMGDDAFVMPTLGSFEDLLSPGRRSADRNHRGSAKGNVGGMVQRLGQRIRGKPRDDEVVTPSPKTGGSSGAGTTDRAPWSPRAGGLGAVKDRAKAKIAGVIKWASSPRGRRAGGFAG